MANAGPIENRPVRLADRTLIPHHQCHNHSGIGLALQGLLNPIAQRTTATFKYCARAKYKSIQPLLPLGPHTTGGAHALAQQPCFVVKTIGVCIAMRTPQAHRPLPAFTRLQVGQSAAGGFI